tara:strand:+ start:2213 stop:2542 length:330 start_codon:yes stop_codon:yes gene_type:complete
MQGKEGDWSLRSFAQPDMSVRQNARPVGNPYASNLRADIEQMRAAEPTELTFEQLTETEKSAASIGVHPDAWRPISFINNAHYSELLKKNVLSGRLTQQIEAYKTVSAM